MTKLHLTVVTYISLGVMAYNLGLILSATSAWHYVFPWAPVASTLLGFIGVCICYVVNQQRIKNLKAQGADATNSQATLITTQEAS